MFEARLAQVCGGGEIRCEVYAVPELAQCVRCATVGLTLLFVIDYPWSAGYYPQEGGRSHQGTCDGCEPRMLGVWHQVAGM